jgi:hypothetical protein
MHPVVFGDADERRRGVISLRQVTGGRMMSCHVKTRRLRRKLAEVIAKRRESTLLHAHPAAELSASASRFRIMPALPLHACNPELGC